MTRLSFDIFCRVVDNFGDIGVCWRLARQLMAMPEVSNVRLWVDDLHSFLCIERRVDTNTKQQAVDGVEIRHWTEQPDPVQPHDIVVEAFACEPPAAFIEAMVTRNSLWINLEYLSAESWIESCHAMPSSQATGLRKYFYFPGFTPATGGLLREPALLPVRDKWLANPALRWDLLRAVGMPPAQIESLQNGGRQVFLFCYPDAPAEALVQSLNQQETPTVLIVPSGVYPTLSSHQSGALQIHQMPFVDQPAFDRLLWSSDLNFVRGEDSLVRALWAGKPLVWQIYPQEANAHMIKLQAWLDRSPYQHPIHQLMQSWNTGDQEAFASQINSALQGTNWTDWRSDSAEWSRRLADAPDLASSLVGFCTQQQRSG